MACSSALTGGKSALLRVAEDVRVRHACNTAISRQALQLLQTLCRPGKLSHTAKSVIYGSSRLDCVCKSARASCLQQLSWSAVQYTLTSKQQTVSAVQPCCQKDNITFKSSKRLRIVQFLTGMASILAETGIRMDHKGVLSLLTWCMPAAC